MTLLFISLVLFSWICADPASGFGYGKERMKEWPDKCNGTNQSPIRIESHKAIPLSIPALEMVGFRNLLPRTIRVANNGHSVELNSIPVGYAKIFGALLDGEYDVIGIHFHWGRNYGKGSEHKINSISFPMEMHIVTRNSKYRTTEEALMHDNGLAVMGFFYYLREKGSSSLEPLLDELEMIIPDGSTVYMDHSFTLASLIPVDMSFFYTYRGSLTTPPCSEVVTWLIFTEPMPISYSQMKKFRSLRKGSERLVDNYRPLRHQGARKVFVRRQPTDIISHREVQHNISSPYFWGTAVHHEVEIF